MKLTKKVLNLVISGIPSILKKQIKVQSKFVCFKPCYKWNTFNTYEKKRSSKEIR